MKRLDYRLKESSRVSWANTEAQKCWEPRAKAINSEWLVLERQLVSMGHRAAALQYLTPMEIPKAIEWAKESHMTVAIIGYDSQLGLRLVFTRKVDQFQRAWRNQEHAVIGALLGYPSCCIRFFESVWGNQQRADTTWFMTEMPDNGEVKIASAPYTSMMLSRLGVRFVPHLPCSFNCKSSIALARENMHAWEKTGDHKALAWAKTMLSWPVEWTALHGLSEVKTPYVRILSNSEATVEKFTIRIEQGTVTEPLNTWSGNGFTNLKAMDVAHKSLVQAVIALTGNTVVDLGCGNGCLLHKLKLMGFDVLGVEVNPETVKEGGELYKDVTIMCENLRDFNPFLREGITLLSTQRLKEIKEGLDSFHTLLKSYTKELILYGYYGDFDKSWVKIFEARSWKVTAQATSFEVDYVAMMRD